MELLKHLFFILSYSYLSTSNFFNLILSLLIIKICSSSKIQMSVTQLDIIPFFINFINLISNLVSIQCSLIISKLQKTYFGNTIISSYNYINNIYINFKATIISYPFKLIMNKIIGFELNNFQEMPQGMHRGMPAINKFKTNDDVSKFLNSLQI